MKQLEVYLPTDWPAKLGLSSGTQSTDRGWHVGTLAESDLRCYFEYAPEFLRNPVWLSPFKLPPESGLREHRDLAFGPLFGLFDDSLPDGWGLLLMDRYLHSRNVALETVSPLDRLAFLGARTMGALSYYPPSDREPIPIRALHLHELAKEAYRVLRGPVEDVLPQLLQSGGSPGGARPKILVGLKGNELVTAPDPLPDGYEGWMIKFHAREDAVDDGRIEYAYSQMARAAGILMPPTRLFTTGQGDAYFGVARFDRTGSLRHHVHTFGNLIHANFRVPGCDYRQLLRVTRVLTRNQRDVEAALRVMVFNIAAHNRDDHVKNFAFILPAGGDWQLAPAYDLTFSPGPGGEHTMTVAGEGRRPTLVHVQLVADEAGIAPRRAAEIVADVHAAVAAWPAFAAEAGLSLQRTQDVQQALSVLS
ncbi:MAG: type II toxin-antitoxin system HipA family toxin [Kiritimatiellia bacterium]